MGQVLNSSGLFYSSLTKRRKDQQPLKSCMEETVEKLLANVSTVDRPGILLGKIQSGKTRAFIGIIALAFDNGYDMAIILTKGTKALAQQTYQRLKVDFAEFMDVDDIQLFDIMHVPENLPKYILSKKLIMVVKKETNNLSRVITALVETYPDLGTKKLLIIDDEADYASVGFNKSDGDAVEMRKVASQIDELRTKVNAYGFLQVTATPYSLYLQPETPEMKETHQVFKPVRPAFTVLLPTYSGYVGGDFYFRDSADGSSMAAHMYREIPARELEILKKQDRRSFKLEDVLTSACVATLRGAIVNFVVGACIRRLQQRKAGQTPKKYSFVVHTESSKSAHQWQEEIVSQLISELSQASSGMQALLAVLVTESYANLAKSIGIAGASLPAEGEVLDEVTRALTDGYAIITKVNSEKEVEQLLDDKGQLKLTTPLNIFIGGQILDRGITIENLVGFYYGRRPYKFQQDTVLQHSRMFGNRSNEDLAVTRFYTSLAIYTVMRRINDFDGALRDAFESGVQGAGVVFICADPSNRIIPCSPNKILLSTTTTLKPFKRMLPIGFNTDHKTNIKGILSQIDRIIGDLEAPYGSGKPFLIDAQVAKILIDQIDKLLIFDEGRRWDIKAFKASIEYLSHSTKDPNHDGKVWCLIRRGRNVSRVKDDGTYFDAPDTAKDEGAIARTTATDIPMLMLFRQNGEKAKGWMDSPFWWPVLMTPQETRPTVFASELID